MNIYPKQPAHALTELQFVGLMCADYADLLSHDLKSAPTYTATGTSRCIISNRISYFFDWHGPSVSHGRLHSSYDSV